MRLLPSLAAVLLLAGPARANPSMDYDFQNMMGWLSHEVVQGLAFNAGETFDPPSELSAWHIQPDIGLGIGVMPLNKGKFPTITTPALAAMNPSSIMPDQVRFPNLALHLRLGLPGRLDVTGRVANMTVPKGYQLSNQTTGDGQSNSYGFGLRKHLFGGEWPTLSLGANYNHVTGHFGYQDKIPNLDLGSGVSYDVNTTGRLDWDVRSYGINAIVSQNYGVFTPFAGLGWNYMTGSLRSRLQATFGDGTVVPPIIGDATAFPEARQLRFIFGTQLDRSHFSMFMNGEVKADGENAGQTFILHLGFMAPFRIGPSSLAARGERSVEPAPVARKQEPDPIFRLSKDERPSDRWTDAPAPLPSYYRARRIERDADSPPPDRDLPQMIFIQ